MTIDTHRVGILLVNLGTPETPAPKAVRHFLREFLWDKRVIDLPRFLWWIILHTFVLPFRAYRTAHAYQQVWKKEGSPLRVLSEQVTQKLKETLLSRSKNFVEVVLGMRYGAPSLEKSLSVLQQANISQLIVLPLYPQYSSTTTASVFDEVTRHLKSWSYLPTIKMINQYSDNSLYIEALAASIRDYWDSKGQAQHLLFSFHGIPKRYANAGDPYEKLCRETARRVAEALDIDETRWSLAFQSRFGRAEWLQPYCDQVIRMMPTQEILHLDVVCPGFPVDCLETLEEIAIRYQSIFLHAGGKQFRYIPALNTHPAHVEALAAIVSS